jgi:hypothetical protein
MSRRLAAILTADVAGYSRLMGADEERTHGALAQGIELKPAVDSLARWRERFPWGNAQYSALYNKTVAVGLRGAGFPETSAIPNTVTTGPPARD